MPDVYCPELLDQTATYWAPTGKDGYGKTTFAAPVSIDCFWVEKAELFIDKAGKETRSKAIVQVDRDLSFEGYLMPGTSTDPTPPANAKEIRGWAKAPGIPATQFVRQAFL